MIGKTAFIDDAKCPAWCTQMLFTTPAGCTFATTNPGIYDTAITDVHAFSFRTGRNHLTKDLVPQHHPFHTNLKLFAIAQFEHAVVQVDIRVANTTGEHCQ